MLSSVFPVSTPTNCLGEQTEHTVYCVFLHFLGSTSQGQILEMPGLPPVSPILTSETVIHQFSVGYSQQECLLAWGPQSLLPPTLTSNSRQNFAQHKSNTALFFSSYSEEKPKNPNDPCFLIHRSDFVFDICLPPLLCRTLSSHCSVSSTPAHTTFLLWHKLFPQIRHKFHLDFWADTTLLQKPFLLALWRWGVHLGLGCFYSVLWLLWICHMWPVSSLCNLSPSTVPFSYPRSSLAARSGDAPSLPKCALHFKGIWFKCIFMNDYINKHV